MIGKIMLRGTVALGALVMTTAPVLAGTAETLLKRLHEKGILTDEEYNELLAEAQAEEQAEAGASPAAAASAVPAPATSGDDLFVRRTESGIGFEVGPATIKFAGAVNAFYVHDNPATPSASTSVVGALASVGTKNSSAVRNGSLPGFLTVSVATRQAGWDINAFFGLYPGINSTAWGALGANNGGNPVALGTSGIDARQTYLTIGKPKFGTVKLGRDIGLFGSDAILNDITLLSSGTPAGNVAPGNTTMGRIGAGYMYTDFQPQMTYTTPSLRGFQASVGVFQPLSSLTGQVQANSQPGFQAKLTYDGTFAGVGAHLWASGITQKHDILAGGDYTGKGVDMGAKVTAGPLAVTGYYYTAKGLGTTALGLFDTDGSGNARSSDGFYVQGLATFGKVSVGGSYGESSLDYANAADALANPDLVKTNSSYVGHGRYSLTSWVTLIGEYVHSKGEAHSGNAAFSDAIVMGGILFF